VLPEQASLSGEPVIETENESTTASINTITSWIKNCDRSHSLCSKDETPRLNRQFARILDIGDVPDAPEAKICLPENLELATKYVTFSHCRGGITSELPSLTTATYDEYLQRIAVAGLPQAFQDVIQLTRKLGIRYLWTESLCIIQDCPKDWLDQAGVLGEVYQGSYLNIAADTSLDPNGGLFTIRNSILATPLRISIRGSTPQSDLPSLRLEGTSLLVAEAKTQVLETEIDLNTCLGNRDGNFDLEDKDFAFTARNVELVETTLYAELRTISGEWRYRCVDVRELIEEPSDRLIFRLVGNSTLFISEPQEIDLNECLANRDGAFNTDGTDFAFTAKNISLEGSTLRAELRKINGKWRQDSIDLACCVSWSSGRLRPTKLVETFYDVVTGGHTNWSRQTLEAKTNTKEWVFQESLLAPRVVHFTDRQLAWECSTSKFLDERLKSGDRQGLIKWSELEDPCSVDLLHEPKTRELGIDHIWSSLRAMHGRGQSTFRRNTLSQNPDLVKQAKRLCYGESKFETTHPLIRYWSDIAVSHSIAYPRRIDRLIAVAGLAKILSTRTSFRYVAGLWEIQIPRQLLWTPSYSKEMPTGEAAAPSWSWVSYPGGIAENGIKLEPALETNGAMDLIKVLSIDIEGASEKDDMPFSQVKNGRLLIRGRLLPISLDLGVWPEGATREDTLVQSWTGSTSEAPYGEIYLVPVLLTCCDDGLSDSTPNSLLLESTEEKGVFRRIGTARLSSCCDLRTVTPQFYTAKCVDHEFEEDDADKSETSAEDDGFVIIPISGAVEPDPQQEVNDNATSHHASNDMQYTFLDEASEVAAEPEADPDSERTMTPEEIISSTEREISRWNSLFPKLPKLEEEFDADIDVDELERKMMGFCSNDSAGSNRTKTQSRPKKKVQKLAPKDAVAGHYYIGYIEDDKDVIQYGHFVFEIR